jgi:anthranilate phosphoribosyltransferase
MISVRTPHKTLDIVGTGGDGANSINLSTASALLSASCGVKVVKNGNRAVSSMTGSADVLEALGVNINLSPEKTTQCIDEVGFAFCFSPNFNPAMLKLRELRKKLNVPTTFNMLGPLLNPANPAHLILGVFDESIMTLMAETLNTIGTERSLVVHGAGLDEISCIAPFKILEIYKGKIRESRVEPEKLGLKPCNISELKGGSAKENAEILLKIFSGTSSEKYSAIIDTLILNTATALYLYGLYPSIDEGIPHARENLQNGEALRVLKNLIEFSHD